MCTHVFLREKVNLKAQVSTEVAVSTEVTVSTESAAPSPTSPSAQDHCTHVPLGDGETFPGALCWFDYIGLVATCRGAVPRQHRLRAEFQFRIERQLRLRLRLVRERLPMPATLSVWACALGLWRHFTGHGGFRPSQSSAVPWSTRGLPALRVCP